MSESVVFKQNRTYLSTLPLGSIIAWHKTLVDTKMPVNDFPPGWVPCDGQTINDPESILNGERVPDLNGQGGGKSLFLRGGAVSGNLQDDMMQTHAHQDAGHTHVDTGHYHVLDAVDNSTTGQTRGFIVNPTGVLVTPEISTANSSARLQTSPAQIGDPVDSATPNTQPARTGGETRPANMSVIWIMKIKQIADVPITQAVQADVHSPTGAIYIGRNGDVGVGVQQPQARLDVGGDLVVSGTVKGAPNQGLNLADSLLISPNGNIGVGTNLPQAKLDVGGDLKLQFGSKVNTIAAQTNFTDKNDTIVLTEKAVKDYVDTLFAGSVSSFAMTTPPDGWLECNGQAVSRSTYALLFKKIGTGYGGGDGSTSFNLPDLRGVFVRGWDHGRGIDPGRSLGNFQSDQMQSHKHLDAGHTHTDNGHGHTDSGHWHYRNSDHAAELAWRNNASGGYGTWVAGPDSFHQLAGVESASANITMGNARLTTNAATLGDPANSGTGAGIPRHGGETRPQNVALLYCIKY